MRTFTTILLLFVTLTFAGCGQARPKVCFVEGVVTLDGKPVADADVSFSPASGGATAENYLGVSDYYATGTTDANGVYHLTSTRGGGFGEGAVAGHYDVRISKFYDPDEAAAAKKIAADRKNSPILGDAPMMPMANPRHFLPERYADAKTSGLSAAVKKGKNTINFELKSK